MDPKTELRIVSALTRYDEKQSKKRHYNPYALPIYFMGVSDAKHACKMYGKTVQEALAMHFCGPLLHVVLKAAGEK